MHFLNIAFTFCKFNVMILNPQYLKFVFIWQKFAIINAEFFVSLLLDDLGFVVVFFCYKSCTRMYLFLTKQSANTCTCV